MNKQLSPNFHEYEFRCRCREQGHKDDPTYCQGITIVDPTLVQALQVMRGKVKVPITINCGYRCPVHNRDVGGVIDSQHILGKAADIVIEGMNPEKVAHLASAMGFKGVGLYNTFTHVDVREGPLARWDYREKGDA